MKKMIILLVVLASLVLGSVGVSAAGTCCACKTVSGSPTWAMVFVNAISGVDCGQRCSDAGHQGSGAIPIASCCNTVACCNLGLDQGELRSNTEVCLSNLNMRAECCGHLANSLSDCPCQSSTKTCQGTGEYQCANCGDICGAACLLKGTKVTMADGSQKNIEDIVKGDLVLSFNYATKQNQASKVLNTFVKESNTFFLINDVLKVTGRHQLLVNGKWEYAVFVQKGDKLQGVDGEEIVVDSIKTVTKPNKVRVYDLYIEGTHTYYAENLIVHNDDQKQETPEFSAAGIVLAVAMVLVAVILLRKKK